MSDKYDDWNDPIDEEFTPEEGEQWDEYFNEEHPKDSASEAEPLEEGDTFPIDEAFFDGDTSVLPAEAGEMAEDAGLGQQGADSLDYDNYDYGDDDDDEEDPEDDGRYTERAIRLNRRRRTGLLGGMMYAAFILGVGTILALLGWMWVDDILGLTKDDVPVEITIPHNFTIEDVAHELYAQGVINHQWLFIEYVNMFGGEERIEPGVYQVRPVDFRAIIRSLNQRTGELVAVRVTIPEGRTMMETFAILEYNGVSTVEALREVADTVSFDNFEFLAGLPMNTMNRLEGYLFPDTYDFFLGQSPESAIRTMLRNFDVRMQMNDIYELVEESEFTLHEILNIAAMIEGEMASVEEAPQISSVIHNRIRTGMHLGIDATIQYILPERTEFVLYAHLRIESPYNTYLHLGLPYGPVGNPGVAAILAALNPDRTDFFFYALHVDGHHHFTRTYAEHQAFTNSPDFVHYGWGTGGGGE
ncbi:MAG: endolytic transglycosylase MltG [Oscillospiraceae bacterium]|nr:endolytic transglycosylase MltG [Oscillospiraceae bacterium]